MLRAGVFSDDEHSEKGELGDCSKSNNIQEYADQEMGKDHIRKCNLLLHVAQNFLKQIIFSQHFTPINKATEQYLSLTTRNRCRVESTFYCCVNFVNVSLT